MAADGSGRVVLRALIGNASIAATKFLAAALTGSVGMFAEAVHSVVDTGNQALLFLGMRRARRPADARHPFGYGKELYFWSFVVAILLFSLGAGVSIWEGVHEFDEPEPVENVWVAFLVLLVAMGFEGWAFRAARAEFDARRGEEPPLAYLRRSKDSALFTVLFEDLAALIGLSIAFVMLAASVILGLPELDAIASILIGVLLAGAAVVLSIETKGLLVGEGADPEVTGFIRGVALADPRVERVNEAATLHFGPYEVLATLSLDFRDDLSAGEVERAVTEIERALKAGRPEIRRVFVEAQSFAASAAETAARRG